jgi:catechol 2,3-dioxygenase-like lactoylglutathione lyase family enzyme
MPVTGLFHVAIKTANLARTNFFYERVIGLHQAPRPDFGYPGAWLAVPTPVGEAIVHIYAGGPVFKGLAPGEAPPSGSAAIDHLSLTATGWNDFRARFKAHGLPWREFIVPGTTYWQLFVYDPNGVQLELTFDARAELAEPGETGLTTVPDIAPDMRYQAGVSFFDSAAYEALG